MKREGIVRLAVEEHFAYRPETPERFDWSLVINPRVQEISQDLCKEILVRCEQAVLIGGEDRDPTITGLREALRVIARKAIWATMTEAKARSASSARWRLPNEFCFSTPD